jgi:hypothetical protein
MIFKVIHMKMKDIWAKIKSLKAWQRFLLLIGTYVLIALIISSSILVYINDVFLAEVPVDKNLSNIYNGQLLNLTGIPKGATCLSFSHDNEYYTYILNGSLYIKNCRTNSLKKQITERVPITYAIIMNDRNIVIYFFNKVNSTTGNLVSSSKKSSSKSSPSSNVDSNSSEEISSDSSSDSSESSSNASDINSSSIDSSSDTSSLENSLSTHSVTFYQYMTASSSTTESSSTSVSESSSNGESSSEGASSSGIDSSSDNGSSSSQSDTSHESSNSQSSSSKSSSSKPSSSTTYTPPSNAEKIILRTYNIDNGNNTDEQAFYANSGSTIKQVVYSSLTNIIYVNTESGSKYNIVNNVYKINIMNNIWIYSYNKVIDNMVLFNNEDYLYFQDKNGYIYYNNSSIYLFKESVKLIGRDGEDNVYFQSKTKHGTIYVVKGKKIVNTITLTDLSFSHFYNTYSNIYAIYVDYIIDITKDTTKKISYDNQNTFMDIVGERIYLKNPSGQYLSLVYS